MLNHNLSERLYNWTKEEWRDILYDNKNLNVNEHYVPLSVFFHILELNPSVACSFCGWQPLK